MKTRLALSTKHPEKKQIRSSFYHKILDVKLYCDPTTQDILIGFDLISNSYDNFIYLPLSLEEDFNIYRYNYSYEMKLFQEIWQNASEEEKTFFSSNYLEGSVLEKKSNSKFLKNAIYYQLPLNPDAALNWLGAFTFYLNNYGQEASIHFKEYTSEENFLKGVSQIDCIQTYKKENLVNGVTCTVLIEAILSLKNNAPSDRYSQTMKAIGKVYNTYRSDRANGVEIPFLAYLEKKSRLSLINDEPFLERAKNLIHANQKNKIEASFQGHNELIIKQLLANVIGQAAYDRGSYSWLYLEFSLLISAQFSMTPEGKLSLVSLETNPCYQAYYGSSKMNENIEAALVFLAKMLDLAFDKKDFKSNGIVFDAASTEKLLNLGIICVKEKIQEVKKKMYAQNFWSLFGNSNVNEPKKETNILDLRTDILNVIQQEMETSCRRATL